MKNFLRARVAPACILLFAVAFAWSLFTRSRYEKVRADVNRASLAVLQMGSKERSFLSEVQSNWICKVHATNEAHADSIRAFGLSPSVSNLIRCQGYEMPAYSWLSINRNREAALMGLSKMTIKSVDKALYVAVNGKLAFVRARRDKVYVFRDTGDGSLGLDIFVDMAQSPKAAQPTRGAE